MPPGGSHVGYAQDLCSDFVRQVMGENFAKSALPSFSTHSFMSLLENEGKNSTASAPVAIPYMSWSIERDGIGGWVWNISPEFPFQWLLTVVSLLVVAIASWVWIGKMMGAVPYRLPLAIGFTLFNVPRHFKAFHHFEYFSLHWVYLILMLDSFIWKEAIEKKTLRVDFELLRILFQIALLGSTGYLTPVMALEWVVVRIFLIMMRPRLAPTQKPIWIFNAILAFVYVPLLFVWYVPLLAAMKQFGAVTQWTSFYAISLTDFFKPLFWYAQKIDQSETVVTIGWTYWLLITASLFWAGKRAWILFSPFLVVTTLFILYAWEPTSKSFAPLIQKLIPLMEFFRVTSRVGLFLPPLLGVMGVIGLGLLIKNPPKHFKKGIRIWCFVCLLEMAWLTFPFQALPPLAQETQQFYKDLRDSPGNRVLDMPFCVAGGNGACTDTMCPNYPYSTVVQCMRLYHRKEIFGLYQARMNTEACRRYDAPPYAALFDAWKRDRCLSPPEWDNLCSFLNQDHSLSAILIYPDLWRAIESPQCRQEVISRLGNPVAQAKFAIEPSRTGSYKMTRILRFTPHCKGSAGVK